MRRALYKLRTGSLAAVLLCLGSAAVISAWASPTTKPEPASQGAPAWAVKPSDTDTGGGMGGTGHSVDNPQGMLVPLSQAVETSCLEGDILGRYQLVSPSGSAGSRTGAGLCANTVYVLNEGWAIEMILSQAHELTVQAGKPGVDSSFNSLSGRQGQSGAGSTRLQIRRVSHPAWGERLEIDIYAISGPAQVKIKKEILEVNAGFVGQVWIEGAQVFVSLRRHRQN